MATIKPIEARSVHQIQSGQVIVDLCSVAKELVENSLDAGATSIEIRFKNNGLDSIEVQDNGSGISRENYENVALKHYTSKLSSYEDLSRLHTFGFRGEALSSLCALADFHVLTAQAHEAPKATRLDFEPSGKLQRTQLVAGQKGTTVSVDGIFKRLPVRRRELEKNIKREYGKVLNLLHAYACVSTNVRFSAKNSVGKTRNVVVFSTKGNPTTKENIANVYGAKTLLALIPLDLTLSFEPSTAAAGTTKGNGDDDEDEKNKIFVRGHVSRPVFGEGRQTPDRQMFFVNSRPCALPQIAKAFNEVYRSFNVSQSPFVFADFHMDTNAYDVNVSPDKRTILLHDAGTLIETLKTELTGLFEGAEQTVPQSQVAASKASGSRVKEGMVQSLLSGRSRSSGGGDGEDDDTAGADVSQASRQGRMKSLLSGLGSRQDQGGANSSPAGPVSSIPDSQASSVTLAERHADDEQSDHEPEPNASKTPAPETVTGQPVKSTRKEVEDTQADEEMETPTPHDSAPSSQQTATQDPDSSMETPNTIQNAFDRMRPRRVPAELATITIGNRTVTSMVGSGVPRKRDSRSIGAGNNTTSRKRLIHTPSRPNIFGKHMRDFAAPGTQMEADEGSNEEEEEQDDEYYDDHDDEEDSMSEDEQVDDDESDHGSESYAPSQDQPQPAPDTAMKDPDIDDGHISGEEEPSSQPPSLPTAPSMNDEEKKKHEEAEVERLIHEAEEKAVLPQEINTKRANKMNKGAYHRDATVNLASTVDGSFSRIQSQMAKLQETFHSHLDTAGSGDEDQATISHETAEERLSLTVTKDDFSRMRIIGQFNLGFILATRSSQDGTDTSPKDELFIIDQHASDEKFNFERLQAETVVQNQRLVQPKRLDLTAVEEEIVIENQAALEKNGFIVEVDQSGDEPIGRRCKLVSLPLSKEVVFGVRDLEELIVLLSEAPATSIKGNEQRYIPRPSNVRKMFAMRACRSSIMIGKNLTTRQMQKVVRNMGTIDKPWNCPHGRPTMRHLMSLGQWNEWDEFGADYDEEEDASRPDDLEIWRDYLDEMASSGSEGSEGASEGESAEEDEVEA